MKKLSAMLLTLVLLLSLTACGGSAANSSASMTTTEVNFDSAADVGWTSESKTEPETPAETEMDGGSAAAGAAQANAKMIYTGELYLQTKEFDQALSAIDSAVEELGGYYESHDLSQGGSYRALYATVRVPQEHFTAFMDQAGQAAHVTDRVAYQEDVSEQYYDVESRLTTQRTKLERLQELLQQAESMEDIITLESAISDTELTIEQLTGSLRKYDSRINYSTVTLTLDEVYRLSSEETPVQTFGQRLSAAFERGLEQGIDGMEDFVISLARNWVTLLIWAAIIAAAAVIARRQWKKRHRSSAASHREE